MEQNKNITSVTCYFFIIFIISGSALLAYTLFYGREGELFHFFLFSALGLLFIGIGEWINHPLQKSLAFDEEKPSILKKVRHRKRSPIALGNLLEITGLILIFVGLAYLF